jgi:hypothetical protein
MEMTKADFDRLWNTLVPAQREEELWWLCQKLNELQPKRCLEIGGGATSIFWGFFAPTISLTLANYVDSGVPHVSLNFDGFEHHGPYLERFGATTYICNSHKQTTLEQVTALGPYDFLFIDGDHSRIGIEQDIKMYVPLVQPGGIVAFHDWDHEGTYPPDPPMKPTQVACRNTGLVIHETCVAPANWYGIAVHHVPK